MKYLKIFIAGITFPSVLFPFLILAAWAFEKSQYITNPFLHFVPLIWGIWNILYFACFLKVLPENSTIRLLLVGGILGFLVAVFGVFGLNVSVLLGLPKSLTYLPLILAPILYAIFWLFIVNPLTHLLGVFEKPSGHK